MRYVGSSLMCDFTRVAKTYSFIDGTLLGHKLVAAKFLVLSSMTDIQRRSSSPDITSAKTRPLMQPAELPRNDFSTSVCKHA